MKRPRQKDGLWKRCDCPKKSEYRHPWQFACFHKTCGCPADCPPELRKAHRSINDVRLSLHKHLGKTRGYWMSKSEAEALRDTIRGQIRGGTFRTATPIAGPVS